MVWCDICAEKPYMANDCDYCAETPNCLCWYCGNSGAPWLS
uniref:Zinc knuckle protein n=2 Tax=unclassified Caudoviricetes TaxID=2788787 RepID=A0A8S5UN60_9CAUD|nr:MAG TPA: zinc knuckle protein [Siphoviridae sp. ctsus30]DAE50543.1 MAG TPA: zinc knuckle protein [Caudoviricetes sp.]DAF95850.1 MAG TPA: zinc knuckle protein [Siphoviridae sp. ctKGQ3]DAQ02230.1 MAG TPA: zinc knuckle protein [Caudoviricetes sp.]